MTIRRGIFWTHLVAGLVCGLVIALMALTGTVYAFQPQILDWARRDVARVEVPAGTARKTVDELAAAVRVAKPDATPSGITLSSDPAEAVVVAMGRGKPSLYVNPYTAEVSEDTAGTIGEVLAFNLRLHRWLALGGDNREIGKAVTGFCSAAFLVLSLTGLYIWWPRRWTLRALRPSLVLNTKARGKARDWNWHNVLGFWSLPLLITLSATGMMISYKWAGNLLYIIAGETPPAAPAGAGGAGGPPAGGAGARPAEGAARPEGSSRPEGAPREGAPRAEGSSREGAPRPEGAAAPAGSPAAPRAQQGGARIAPPTPDAKPLTQEALFEIARGEYSAWSAVTFRIQAANTARPAAGGANARPAGAEGEARPARGDGEARRPRGEGEAARPRREAPAAVEGAVAETKAAVEGALAEGKSAAVAVTEAAAPAAEGEVVRPRRARQGGAATGLPVVSLTVRRGDRLPIAANVSLTLNPYTGEVIKREGFEDKTLGAQMRGSVKGVHTGEAFGIVGQFLMFCASIVTLILVYTGFALSWRRFFPKKKKAAVQVEPAV